MSGYTQAARSGTPPITAPPNFLDTFTRANHNGLGVDWFAAPIGFGSIEPGQNIYRSVRVESNKAHFSETVSGSNGQASYRLFPNKLIHPFYDTPRRQMCEATFDEYSFTEPFQASLVNLMVMCDLSWTDSLVGYGASFGPGPTFTGFPMRYNVGFASPPQGISSTSLSGGNIEFTFTPGDVFRLTVEPIDTTHHKVEFLQNGVALLSTIANDANLPQRGIPALFNVYNIPTVDGDTIISRFEGGSAF